jgi:hypothetical protein
LSFSACKPIFCLFHFIPFFSLFLCVMVKFFPLTTFVLFSCCCHYSLTCVYIHWDQQKIISIWNFSHIFPFTWHFICEYINKTRTVNTFIDILECNKKIYGNFQCHLENSHKFYCYLKLNDEI